MNAVVDSEAVGDPSSDADGVGASLRRLREAQGWSMDDVSARVKFSVRQIDALENERWDDLPKGLSLRGLIRNYVRMLDADAEALIAALEARAGATAIQREPLVVDSTSRPLYQEPDSGAPWLWIVVILAVLGAVLAYAFGQGWLPFLPAGWSGDSPSA